MEELTFHGAKELGKTPRLIPTFSHMVCDIELFSPGNKQLVFVSLIHSQQRS